ncbi:hypothetical protein [Frankia sp. QA3]|uniref:hypothetical protein n=1 Tax=Frankia sp. QA3 TaxID=710111 RepID=UPI000269C327|nr:hypothetical protein [Frankia sp. QA3]EIV93195.1 hypothetical protein FraQA3DRAFT_2875 [Frankia sp. QA3]
MAIAMTRILSRRPGAQGRAPTPSGAGTRPLPGPGAGADVLPRRAGGLPHELVFRVASASRRSAVRQVRVETDEEAVLADWASRGRVELMAARRPFVLELDLDGRGVRLVEPMGRVPVAAFAAGRAGGRVRLADGGVLRWLTPTRGEFSSGLVGHREVNIIRFALDGTALVVADPDLLDPEVARVVRVSDAGPGDTRRGDVPDPRLGWLPDVVALLVLAWFLRLLESTSAASARSRVRDLGV